MKSISYREVPWCNGNRSYTGEPCNSTFDMGLWNKKSSDKSGSEKTGINVLLEMGKLTNLSNDKTGLDVLENLKTIVSDLLNSLNKQIDTGKLYEDIIRAVHVNVGGNYEELAAAASQVYDFLLFLWTEAKFLDTASDPDTHGGNLVPTNVTGLKGLLEGIEQMKLEKENMVMELSRSNEKFETVKSKQSETEHQLSEVKSQLTAAQKLNILSETRLKDMAKTNNLLELRTTGLQSQVNHLELMIERLNNELVEERTKFKKWGDNNLPHDQVLGLPAAKVKLEECKETVHRFGEQSNHMGNDSPIGSDDSNRITKSELSSSLSSNPKKTSWFCCFFFKKAK